MSEPVKHLASFNLARAQHPAGTPEMAEFERQLDPIHALADRAPGFVWREKSDVEGEALTDDVFGDPQMLLNLVVFEDIRSLFEFTFQTAHKKVMTRTQGAFDPHTRAYHVMWWVDEGTRPTMAECKAKLDQLNADGPSPEAFGWANPFDAEGNPLQSFVPNRVTA